MVRPLVGMVVRVKRDGIKARSRPVCERDAFASVSRSTYQARGKRCDIRTMKYVLWRGHLIAAVHVHLGRALSVGHSKKFSALEAVESGEGGRGPRFDWPRTRRENLQAVVDVKGKQRRSERRCFPAATGQ